MIRRDGLLLRGMRWRLGASVLTVLTATVAVATAVLGPLYLHTAGDSLLRSSVAAASSQARGVTFSGDLSRMRSLAVIGRDERLVEDSGPRGRYGAAITTVQSGARLTMRGAGAVNSKGTELYARTGICAHLHFLQGGCQLGRDDVLMTARSADQFSVSVGGRLAVAVSGAAVPERLTVTGIFATPDLGAAYWWGDGPSVFPLAAQGAAAAGTKLTDALVTSTATAVDVPSRDVPQVIAQVPLAPGAVDLADERAVQRTQGTVVAALNRMGLAPSSRLAVVLSAADHQRHVMATIVGIAAVQLVLLAVWVLGSLLVRSSDARRAEARVARLRGFPPGSMLWVTAAEPGLLCLVGVVLGVAVAWAAMLIAKHQLFVASATIAFDPWTISALALTVASIVGALGIGTVRLLGSADLSAGATRRVRATSTASLVFDAVLVVLAVVALIALATTGALNGGTDPLASVAPGLIALGTAVVAVHVILFACRLGVRVSAGSRRVAVFLALRQTSRRPGVLRQGRVLIIALCLTCFATAAWSIARMNRESTARFEVGAAAVVTVRPVGVAQLQAAVARVDPHQRFAMAVVTLHTPSTTLLAVDARRLASTAAWPRGISRRDLATVGRDLAPVTAPVVRLPDSRVAFTVHTHASGQASRRLRDVELGLWVFDQSGGTAIVDVGTLRSGTGSYHADLRGVCPGGCRVAGLGVLPTSAGTPATSGSVQITVTALSPGSTASLRPTGWRSGFQGVRVSAAGGEGLTVTVPATVIDDYANANGATTAPMVLRADHPVVLPAVATDELQSINNAAATGSVPTQGLGGEALTVHPAVSATALPQIGGDGVMVDLNLLSRTQVNPAVAGAVDEVWLGPHAPPGTVRRLRAAGVDPMSVARASTLFAALQKTAPAVADDFLLFATIAALLVAASSTLGALGATTRERATELSSLEVTGIPRRVLVRSLACESGFLVLAALCGAGAGVLAAALAVSSLPSLAVTGLAPLQYRLPAGLLAFVTAVVVGVVVLAAGAVTMILVRRMSPALLRTAPDDVSG